VASAERSSRPASRSAAQQRADRIAAFRAEVEELEGERVLTLSAAQRAAVARHHETVLRALASRFDVDMSEGEKQLSLGMRVASLLGALALAASIYFYFRHFWGLITTPVQVVVLIAAPILGLLCTDFAARREKTGYFAALVGLVTISCFVVDLSMLGAIFNVAASEFAFLAWGAFALLLAYTYGVRVFLVAAILSLAAFVAARTGTLWGLAWTYFDERPENFFAAGLLLFGAPMVFTHRRLADFPPLYRIFGLLTLLLPVLVLANAGEASYLSWDHETIENAYRAFGLVLCAAAIWIGVRRRWRDSVNVGCTLFVIFLYTEFYDWWWDLVPKYVFFLLVGLTAIGALWLLKNLRGLTVLHPESIQEGPS
jgi:hypothetical protein